MARVLHIAVCLSISLAVSLGATAQTTTATINGRVRDMRESAVPAASVTVTARESGLVRRVTTEPDGSFVVPNLAPGAVDILVAAPGFADVKRNDVSIEVGQTVSLSVELTVAPVREAVVVTGGIGLAAVDTSRSVVDAVIPAARDRRAAAERPQLPRAGAARARQRAGARTSIRPSRTRVLISSAGQLGRGGNITIDGADNNDDVVGGPLQNVTQEAVQEFQIATNRFTAETGRSASSVINVVTKSGSDQLRGSASLFAARQPLAGAAGDLRSIVRRRAARSIASSSRRPSAGRSSRTRLFWFGAVEYRNQDGAVLVGARDVADAHDPPQRSRRRRSTTCSARPASTGVRRDADTLMVRYAGEQADDTGASTLDRAIGSASQRQAQPQPLPIGRRHLDAHRVTPTLVNAPSASFSTFDNAIDPVAAGPQLTFPSLRTARRSACRRARRRSGSSSPTRATLVRGAHTLRVGGEWQRVDAHFDLGVFRAGPHRARRGLRRLRSQRRRPGRRRRPAVRGDAAQRQARPGADHPRRRQQLRRAVRPGRLARAARSDAEPRPALRARHRRQEHQPRRRDQPDRAAVPARARAASDLNNFGPRIGFNWAPGDGAHERARRLRHLLRPHHAGDPVARARPRRPRAADRGARRQRLLPRSGDRPVPAVRAVDRATRSPASSCPAPAPPASTSSTTRMQNPTVQQFNLGVAARAAGTRRAARRRRAQPRHALHHRPHGRRRCSTRSSADPIASSISSRA